MSDESLQSGNCYVFVYGTLKQDFPNYHVNAGKRLAGNFRTRERYPLYLEGVRYVPWLVMKQGEGYRIPGQVYEVDESALALMDQLEAVGKPNGYRRNEIVVIDDDSNEEMTVFAYMKPKELLEHAMIRLGPLESYEAEHAALYILPAR